MKIEFILSDDSSQKLKQIAADRAFRSAAALSKSLIEASLGPEKTVSEPAASNPETAAKAAAIPPPPSTSPPKDSSYKIDVSKYEV